MAEDNRTERQLHHNYYDLQREVASAELAITDARDFIYGVLTGKWSSSVLEQTGSMWLARHGRDPLREPDLPVELRGE